jgi:hypothetical protein
MATPHLQSLLNKEVSRKEFVGITLLALGSIMGVGTIIKLFTGKSLETHKVFGDGYGNTAYGGRKDS